MTIRTITLAVALIFSAMAAHAETVEIDVPGSTERILIGLPEGMVFGGSETTEKALKITTYRYFLAGQSISSWDEKIQISMITLPAILSPEGLVEGSSLTFIQDFCAADRAISRRSSTTINGFNAATHRSRCRTRADAKSTPGTSPAKNVEGLIGIAIRGEQHIFHITMHWHTDDVSIDEGDETEIEKRLIHIIREGVLPCDTADSAKPCTLPAQ